MFKVLNLPDNKELYENVRFAELLQDITPSFNDYFREEEAHILEHLTPESRVLEIGCGSGRVMERLAHVAEKIVGADYSRLQLSDAVLKLSEATKVDLSLDDGRRLGIRNDSFDIAYLTWNLLGSYDYEEQLALLQEARRVTKPNGCVIASVFAENAVPFQLEQYDRWGFQCVNMTSDLVEVVNPSLNHGIISRRFTPSQLEKLFSDAGFNDINIERIARFGYIVEARE